METGKGRVAAVCISERRGTPKRSVPMAVAVEGMGISGDGHAGEPLRQVSLLEKARIDTMRERGVAIEPGAFGENLVVEGIALDRLEVGARLLVGDTVVLEITQRGKECHTRCSIYYRTGECIMPEHALFARVAKGGVLKAGAVIEHIREGG